MNPLLATLLDPFMEVWEKEHTLVWAPDCESLIAGGDASSDAEDGELEVPWETDAPASSTCT